MALSPLMRFAAIFLQYLTGRWIFFDYFWLGPTLFKLKTLPGITRVTTEDLDEMKAVFRPPNCQASVTHNVSDRTENALFRFFLIWLQQCIYTHIHTHIYHGQICVKKYSYQITSHAQSPLCLAPVNTRK